MVGQVIKDYLKENRRLVIPGLGAFMKKDDSSVVFAPFLNKNDGVLTNVVAIYYGVPAIEANTIITQYILDVNNSITENGYFFIEGLGSLKKDNNGILYLDSKEPGKAPSLRSQLSEEVKETIIFPQQVEIFQKTDTTADAYDKIMDSKPVSLNKKITPVSDPDNKPKISRLDKQPKEPIKTKHGPDLILIIAIVIAIIAVVVMIYSYFLTKPTVLPLN